MIEFRVWDPSNGARPERTNTRAVSVSEAASGFVEGHWEGMDHPEIVDVIVEGVGGEQFRYTVTATQDVSFTAAPTEPDEVEVERAIVEIEKMPFSVVIGVAMVNRQSVVALLRRLGKE